MRKNRLSVFIENLLFPPRCVGCGELFQKGIFDTCDIPLCRVCRQKWEREKLDRCPDCELEMTICNCSSRLLEKSGVEDAVKLFNYSVLRQSVGKRAVLYMKRHKATRAFDFFATQLSYAVKRKTSGYENKNVLVISVPRSVKSRREYGFDQAELLAVKLSEKCGFRYVKLVKRSKNRTAEQKKKGLAERLKSLKGQYFFDFDSKDTLNGVECIVAVDDLITSGASMAGCIEAVKEHYNGKFICAALGRTGKRRKK